MNTLTRFSILLSLSIACIGACQTRPQARTQLTSVNGSQGGKIVYGAVPGSTTQTAVLISLLTQVHNLSGEKPQVGRVFQFKGTNSVGVFFTVTDHPEGNLPLAGMAIAAVTGPDKVEGAMIYDTAAHFGTTVNPLLKQLFEVWHPGGAASPGGSTVPASGSTTGWTRSASMGRPAPLHLWIAPDRSASVGIPDGWQAKGQMGTMMLMKPRGDNLAEIIQLNLTRLAVDPRANQRFGNNAGKIVYPANVDLARAFPALFQQFWQLNKAPVSDLQVDRAEVIAGPPGQRCVHGTGHAKIGIPVAEEYNALICTTQPGPMGNYMFSISMALLPMEVADQERATTGAILASFQPNQAVIASEAGQMAAPAIGAIQAIGREATARMNAIEVANGAEQANWEAGQTANAQNAVGFSNYLLDQSVVQNNITGVQGTLWNNAAGALVQSNPNKYSYVPNSQINLGSQY